MSQERIQALIQSNRPQEAMVLLRQQLQQDPNDPFALGLLALCHVNLDEFHEAVPVAQKAVEASPEWPWAWHVLSISQLHARKTKDSLKSAERFAQLDPDDPDAWYDIAVAQHQLGQPKKALKAIEKSLQLDPDDGHSRSLYVTLLALLGRKAESLEASAQALAEAPDNTSQHYAHGIACLRARDHKGAAQAFSEALRLAPDHEGAAEGLKEALRHRILPYKVMATIVGYLDRLPNQARWAFWIGIIVLRRIAQATVRQQPHLMPFLMPLFIAYGFLMLFLWLGEELANITLMTHPLGRLALTQKEKATAIVAAVLTLGAIGALVLLLTGNPAGPTAVGFAVVTLATFGIINYFIKNRG